MKFKYFILQAFFLVIVTAVVAQEKFTMYTVQKGEGLSAIAHHFNIPVEQIKEANGFTDKTILKIGQKIKIPSKAVAKKTPVNTAVSANNSHQIHTVGEKETLWSISKKYGVTVEQIKNWNHLSSDAIHAGQQLIIVQPKTEQSSAPVAQTQTPQQKPVTDEPKAEVEQTAQKSANTAVLGKSAGESFFASAFKSTGGQSSGIASTFKTASGWLDKKYYVLINDITEGSIVAVSVNNKVVYAKVLGSLPDIKEDNGILLRINNAAASALGISDAQFDVLVNY